VRHPRNPHPPGRTKHGRAGNPTRHTQATDRRTTPPAANTAGGQPPHTPHTGGGKGRASPPGRTQATGKREGDCGLVYDVSTHEHTPGGAIGRPGCLAPDRNPRRGARRQGAP
jgi:hypothetical protein